MPIALRLLEAFLLLAALGSLWQFVFRGRSAFALWLVANPCSPVSILFVAAHAAGAPTVAAFFSALLMLYGGGGLLLFGWRRHWAVLLPQAIHLAMAGAGVLFLAQYREPRCLLAAGIGLLAGPAVVHLQRRALGRRPDAERLARDPVLGAIYGKLMKR